MKRMTIKTLYVLFGVVLGLLAAWAVDQTVSTLMANSSSLTAPTQTAPFDAGVDNDASLLTPDASDATTEQ